MPESAESIQNKLNVKKIIIPVILGLGVAIYLLFSSLNDSKYVFVGDDKGAYLELEASNQEQNKNAEYTFVGEGKGNYSLEKAKDNLQNIEWSFSMAFWLFAALLATSLS